MTLSPGTRLGPYEILGPIGAGGMGQVFRARDARLGRDVAVKVLPPELADEAERLARFEREARVLAALNHPNVAAIYGVEDAGGSPALVLEMVDGETLADRIARGRLALRDALAVARQVAEGLDAAHEAGIVHRDLKPGNVALTRSGTAKVLDFGLAKPIAGAPVHESDADGDRPVVRFVSASGHEVRAALPLDGVGVPTAVAWSPDGARLAFVNLPGRGAAEVWVGRPSDGDLRKVAEEPAPGEFEGVTWTPDGRSLVVGRIEYENEVVLIQGLPARR